MTEERVTLDEYRRRSRFDWIDTSQPIEPVLDSNWRIRDVLPAEGSGVIYGRSGSGKTFAAIDLCCHVAAGRPWRGHTTKGGTVAYVALEGAGSQSTA